MYDGVVSSESTTSTWGTREYSRRIPVRSARPLPYKNELSADANVTIEVAPPTAEVEPAPSRAYAVLNFEGKRTFIAIADSFANPWPAHIDRRVDHVRRVIKNYENALDPTYGPAVLKRLGALASDFNEEFGMQLNRSSIENFLLFVSHHHEIGRPTTSASREGCIFARWTKSRDSYVSVEFLPTGQCKWVRISPDAGFPEKSTASRGIATCEELIREVAAQQQQAA